MELNEVFEYRKLFGEKLKSYLKKDGYTKISFAKKADISRPTLDRILKGELDSKSTFDKHVQKIFEVLRVSVDEVMNLNQKDEDTNVIDAVYSMNEPKDYIMSDEGKKELQLLKDVLDICAIYY